MKVHHKAHVKWPLALLSMLALTLFLVACGTSEGSTTTPTPTPTPTPSGTAYSGNGYTLRYPQGWKVSNPEPLTAVFTSDSDQNETFTITVTPVTPITNSNVDTALTAGLKLFSQTSQQDNSVPSTVSVGGDTWKQAGATADKSGQNIKGVVMADQHPASTGSIFVITLTAPTANYDQDYTTSFKPILDSFQFS